MGCIFFYKSVWEVTEHAQFAALARACRRAPAVNDRFLFFVSIDVHNTSVPAVLD
jgi:hypothetical protein